MSHSFTHAFHRHVKYRMPTYSRSLSRSSMFKLTITTVETENTSTPTSGNVTAQSLPARLNADDNGLGNYIICHFDSALFVPASAHVGDILTLAFVQLNAFAGVIAN